MIRNKKVVVINSKNKSSGTHSNFTYKIPVTPGTNYTHVAVIQAILPKSFYMCDVSNTYFTLTEPSQAPVNIYITSGNYNTTTFRIVLQQLLNANSPGGKTYTISFPNAATSASTGKYTYTCSSGNPTFTFNSSSNLYELMGFDVDSTNTFSGNTLTSTNVIKMLREDVIIIRSNIAENEGDDILQEIYSVENESFTNIVYRQDNLLFNCKKINNQLSNNYYFRLVNDNNIEIDLRGLNWMLTIILFSFDDDVNEIIKNYIKIKTLQN